MTESTDAIATDVAGEIPAESKIKTSKYDRSIIEGPLGRATLGLRPASLVRVLPGDADPELFHRVPAGAVPGR